MSAWTDYGIDDCPATRKRLLATYVGPEAASANGAEADSAEIMEGVDERGTDSGYA